MPAFESVALGVIANAIYGALSRAALPIRHTLEIDRAWEEETSESSATPRIPFVVKNAAAEIEKILAKKGRLTTDTKNMIKTLANSELFVEMCEAAVLRPPIKENKDGRLKWIYIEHPGLRSAFCSFCVSRCDLPQDELIIIFNGMMRVLSTHFDERFSGDNAKKERDQFLLSTQRKQLIERLHTIDNNLLNFFDAESRRQRSLPPFPPEMATKELRAGITRVSERLIEISKTIEIYGPNQRLKRVLLEDIYVPCGLIHESQYEKDSIVYQIKDPMSLPDSTRRAVVLGAPGGGKSTLTHALTLSLARKSKKSKSKLPIRTEIKSFANSHLINPDDHIDIKDFIINYISTLVENDKTWVSNFVDNLLGYGDAILIFDGLDEILDIDTRNKFAIAVRNFLIVYPLCTTIITSRHSGYDRAPIPGFTTYDLDVLGPDEAESYFTGLSRTVWDKTEDEAISASGTFMDQAGRHSHDLIENPLMVALMTWLFHEREGDLPPTRAKLYKECSDLLFRDWDHRRKIIPDLPEGFTMRAFLTDIAHPMYSEKSLSEGVTKTWLEYRIHGHLIKQYSYDKEARANTGATLVLNYLFDRAWVLKEEPSGKYSFTHRTFMEYFFGRWLNDKNETTETLLSEISSPLYDGKWSVPVILALEERIERHSPSAELIAIAISQIISNKNGQNSSEFRIKLGIDCLSFLSGATESTLEKLVNTICKLDTEFKFISSISKTANVRKDIIYRTSARHIINIMKIASQENSIAIDNLRHFKEINPTSGIFTSLRNLLDREIELGNRDDFSLSKLHLEYCGIRPYESGRMGGNVWSSPPQRLGRKDWMICDCLRIISAYVLEHENDVFSDKSEQESWKCFGDTIFKYMIENPHTLRIPAKLHFYRNPQFNFDDINSYVKNNKSECLPVLLFYDITMKYSPLKLFNSSEWKSILSNCDEDILKQYDLITKIEWFKLGRVTGEKQIWVDVNDYRAA